MWPTILILAMSLGGVMPRPAADFPVDSAAWRMTDALQELRDPDSTPLARRVARMRLDELAAATPVENLKPAKSNRSPVFEAPPAGEGDWSIDQLTWATRCAAASIPYHYWKVVGIARSLYVGTLETNLALLEHGSKNDRIAASRNLAHIRWMASAAFRLLLTSLNAPDEAVRQAAATALAADGASAPVELYIALLADEDPDLRVGAMRALQQFAPDDPRYTQAMHPQPTRDALLAELRNPLPERRLATASYLADHAMIPAPVAAALLRAAKTGDFVAREGLIIGIENAWRDGGEIENALMNVQNDDVDQARRTCAKAALKAIASAR